MLRVCLCTCAHVCYRTIFLVKPPESNIPTLLPGLPSPRPSGPASKANHTPVPWPLSLNRRVRSARRLLLPAAVVFLFSRCPWRGWFYRCFRVYWRKRVYMCVSFASRKRQTCPHACFTTSALRRRLLRKKSQNTPTPKLHRVAAHVHIFCMLCTSCSGWRMHTYFQCDWRQSIHGEDCAFIRCAARRKAVGFIRNIAVAIVPGVTQTHELNQLESMRLQYVRNFGARSSN